MLLIIAGLHVPTIPLGDVVANTGTVPPEHIGVIEAKLGAIVEVQAVLHATDIGVTHVEVPFAVIEKPLSGQEKDPIQQNWMEQSMYQ